MTKEEALIYDLSNSISYARVSLPDKVLWSLLLAKSDDRGRGLAEPDVVTWCACLNVAELTPEAIAGILEEMTSPAIYLLHLYHDRRDRPLYQIIRWWEPNAGSGFTLQWTRPSLYDAPHGWTDRVRLQRGSRGQETRR